MNIYNSAFAESYRIQDTTDSESLDTGCFIAEGGIAVGKRINAGGNIKTVSLENATATTNGSIQTSGGLGVQLDAFIGGTIDCADPTLDSHAATKSYVDAEVSAVGLTEGDGINISIGGVISVDEPNVNHQNLSGAGTQTHTQIDNHIGTANIHFTEASIDHANILNNGTNNHAAIDTHIATGIETGAHGVQNTGTTGQVLTRTAVAGQSQWETPASGVSFVGGTDIDNRILTANGTNEVRGEGNFTFDGTEAVLTGDFEMNGDINFNGISDINTLRRVLAANGSAGAPTYAFTNSTNTGMYRNSNDLLFAENGTLLARFGPTRIRFHVKNTMVDGTAALPAFTFTSDNGSGMFYSSSNGIGISENGAEILRINDAATRSTVPIDVPDGSETLPSYTFTNDVNSGIYRDGASMGFAVSAAKRLKVSTTGAEVTGQLDVTGDVDVTGGSFGLGVSPNPNFKMRIGDNVTATGPGSVASLDISGGFTTSSSGNHSAYNAVYSAPVCTKSGSGTFLSTYNVFIAGDPTGDVGSVANAALRVLGKTIIDGSIQLNNGNSVDGLVSTVDSVTYMDHFLTIDGTVYTYLHPDITDLQLYSGTTRILYIGSSATFTQLDIDVTTGAVYGTASSVWEYWNGTIWASMTSFITSDSSGSNNDGTDSFESSGTISWSALTGWALSKPVPLYLNRYWIRQRFTLVPTTHPILNSLPIDSSNTIPSVKVDVDGSERLLLDNRFFKKSSVEWHYSHSFNFQRAVSSTNLFVDTLPEGYRFYRITITEMSTDAAVDSDLLLTVYRDGTELTTNYDSTTSRTGNGAHVVNAGPAGSINLCRLLRGGSKDGYFGEIVLKNNGIGTTVSASLNAYRNDIGYHFRTIGAIDHRGPISGFKLKSSSTPEDFRIMHYDVEAKY